ncbi:MAG: T9SS type A sorting domain-containing protein, partial [Bacteroidales bacterium]|nr:T9SS type A sorting domain-containing protein [Bacteroidales bacterium]
ILYTDAIEVVVEDNFALMYVWYQGEPLLEEGETREVTFLCNQLYTGIEEAVVNESQGINVVLHQNAPNPFNRLSVISYKLLVAGKVTLKVYNVLGHEVVTLINEQKQPGEYEVEFDGRGLSEGVYFYRLSAGGHSVVKKMVLME